MEPCYPVLAWDSRCKCTTVFILIRLLLDYNGPDTFSYQICEIVEHHCDQAVVSISLSLTDDVPVAVDDSFTTDAEYPDKQYTFGQ